MTTEPDMLTKLAIIAFLLGMTGIYLFLLSSVPKGHTRYLFFGGRYNRNETPTEFWLCVVFNLSMLAVFVLILMAIALDLL
jgi:hypothetical protein